METHPKTTRITVDLSPEDYHALNLWVAKATVALEVAPSRMSSARAIRAMIRAAAADDVVNGVVLDLLRREAEQR